MRPNAGRCGEHGLGLEEFLKVALEAGAINRVSAHEHREAGWEALKAAAAQSEYQAGEEPTRQFGELLAAAIKAGDGQVADAKFNEKPEHADRWR